MKKWFKRIAILLLILVVALIAAPFLLKGKIIKALKHEANTQLNAQVDFNEDIGLSFFKQFPKLTITLKDASVVGIDDFLGDTLAYLPEAQVSVDAMAIINGDRANIKKVYLDQPFINLKVTKEGKANWDIAKADSTPSDSSVELSLGLEQVEIKDGRFSYDDRSMPFSTSAEHLDVNVNGDLEAENFTLAGTVETPSLDMTYNGLNLLHKVKTAVDVQMDMDMKNMKFTFNEGKAKLNNLDLTSDGFVQLNENDMDFDLKFASANTDFKNILSLVPAVFAKDFKSIETKGNMAFSGFMKGKMTDDNYPSFGFKTKVSNGYFKYPDLPEAVKQINLDLNVTNKDGKPDHTVIDLHNFNATVMGEKIVAKAIVKTPISDPLIDAKVKGKLDLAKVKNFYPMEPNENYQGVVDADVAVNTYMSYIETEQYDKVKTEGYFLGKDLLITSSALQDKLAISALDLKFNPKTVNVNQFEGTFGKSDYNLTGKVENLIPYLIKNETLEGDLAFKSNYFNTNPFMTDVDAEQVVEPTATDTAALTYIDIPDNLDIKFKAEVKSLIYDNLNIEDVSGTMQMADKKIAMRDVKGKLLDGSFLMKEGTYDASNPANPFSGLDFKLDQVDIVKSATYLDFIQKLGPIAKYANGLFSIDFKMGTELLNDLSPKYPTFNGEGVIKVSSATIKGLKTLNKMGDILKIEKLKSFNVKDLLVRFKVVNGSFALLDSITLPLWKGSQLKLTGGSTLTGDVNYFGRIDIPRALFGEANTALNGLLDKTKAKGLNIDISNMVPVDALISGSFTNPSVKLDLGNTKKSLIDNVKDQAKKELIKKVDEGKEIGKAKIEAEKARAKQRALDSIAQVKQKAKERADALVAEAEARAGAIKAEARRNAAAQKAKIYAQADSIEAKGADPLQKFAARKAADKLRVEADKKEQQIIGEADKRADAVVNKAREQAARLE